MDASKRPPLYLEVAATLETEIGRQAPNSLLPTEEQLARRYQVSRVTIRAALDVLEKAGLISRMQGRGTLVSPPKVVRRFAPLLGFEQDLEDQGIPFETKLLGYERKCTAPQAIRERLELPSRSTVGRLSLLRIVDDRVVSHERRYYPPVVAARIVPEVVVNRGASRALENLLSEPITEVDWESEITPPAADVAAALGVAPRTLVLENSYTWHIANGRPVEAGMVCYRVDRCKFKYELSFNHRKSRAGSERENDRRNARVFVRSARRIPA